MVRCELLTLSCVLLSATALPVREKISINTDMLEKVRAGFNNTQRDKTARNINFAWRVSYTRTTTVPTVPTTPSIKDIEQNQVEYQKIFSTLTVTLKDAAYRKMWTNLVEKGYSHFIEEVKKGGHKIFIKDNQDGVFDGIEGGKFWNKIVGFLETMGKKGFDLLLSSVDSTPLKTAAPGGPAQADFTMPDLKQAQKDGFTMPDVKGQSPAAEAVVNPAANDAVIKTLDEKPQAGEKVTEAPK